jgi:hypothetical protein
MVSRSQAALFRYGQELHYTGRHECTRVVGKRGGITENVTRVRISGKCQTWKTKPDDFRVPVKYGMYESSAIDQHNAADYHVPFDCPIRQEQIASGLCPACDCADPTAIHGLAAECDCACHVSKRAEG